MSMPEQNNGINEEKHVKMPSFEFIFALGIVFMMSGGVQGIYTNLAQDLLTDKRPLALASSVIAKKSQGNFTYMAILVPMYTYVIWFFVSKWRWFVPVLKRAFPLVLVSLLAILSTFWSLEPKATFLRSCNLFLGTMTGCYFAVRYLPLQFQTLMGKCYLILGIFVFLVVILDPEVGIHHGKHYPSFRGYFSHKNIMGDTMVYGLIVSLFLLRTTHAKILGLWLFTVSGLLIIMSLSRTAWLLALFSLIVYLLIMSIRAWKFKGLLLVFIVIFTSVFILSLVGYETIASEAIIALERDPTVSGRTEIWEIILDAILPDHFWFGFGYEAFWSSTQGAFNYFRNQLGFIPAHSHNGWLQIMVHLGFSGVILVAIAMIIGIKRSYIFAFSHTYHGYAVALVFLVMYFVLNIVESYFMAPERLYWEIFVYYVACNPKNADYLQNTAKISRNNVYTKVPS